MFHLDVVDVADAIKTNQSTLQSLLQENAVFIKFQWGKKKALFYSIKINSKIISLFWIELENDSVLIEFEQFVACLGYD